MRLTIRSLLVTTVVLVMTRPVAAQFTPFRPLPPSAPLFPTSYETCDAYEKQWTTLRKWISDQHSACLKGADGQSEAGTTCTVAACQSLHEQMSSVGRAEVRACRKAVAEHLEEKRRQEEAAREREREQQEAARRAAEDAGVVELVEQRAQRVEDDQRGAHLLDRVGDLADDAGQVVTAHLGHLGAVQGGVQQDELAGGDEGGNVPAEALSDALDRMSTVGVIERRTSPTATRPIEEYRFAHSQDSHYSQSSSTPAPETGLSRATQGNNANNANDANDAAWLDELKESRESTTPEQTPMRRPPVDDEWVGGEEGIL